MTASQAQLVLVGSYGEMALKGANRGSFERALVRAARAQLPPETRLRVGGGQLRAQLPPAIPGAVGEAAMGRIFGLSTVRVAHRLAAPVEVEALGAVAVALARQAQREGARSFKISARRQDKTFGLTSPELNRELGTRVAQATGLGVDVHHPDLDLGVDVRGDGAYLWGHALPGAGGLPSGISGRALCLLSGGIDSPVAAYLAARRGLDLSCVYFHTFPYTGDGTLQKVLDLCSQLATFVGEVRLWVVPFTAVQLAIQEQVAEPWRTLVVRRMMLRISEVLARRERAGALVTGDSLGQVASQTLESLSAVGEVATLPLLRPLVAMDKVEIVALARRIGTYPISIRPFEDCCTVFAPRHPRTRPTRADVRAAEAPLDVSALMPATVGASRRWRVDAREAREEPEVTAEAPAAREP